MQYKSGTIGRVFLVKFEHGDDPVSGIKDLAAKEDISLGSVTFLGALESSRMVVGPKEPKLPPEPEYVSFNDGREVLGFGTIVKKEGEVNPHIHATLGKGRETLTGCLREDCKTFVTIEAVVTEIKGISAERRKDDSTGLNLLSFK